MHVSSASLSFEMLPSIKGFYFFKNSVLIVTLLYKTSRKLEYSVSIK